MKLEKIALALTVAALIVLIAPSAFACPPPPPEPGLSPGFWKHEVRAHLPEGSPCGSARGAKHYSTAEMIGFVDAIDAAYFGDTDTFTFCYAYVRLWDKDFKSDWLTIANWFNEAAGLAPYED